MIDHVVYIEGVVEGSAPNSAGKQMLVIVSEPGGRNLDGTDVSRRPIVDVCKAGTPEEQSYLNSSRNLFVSEYSDGEIKGNLSGFLWAENYEAPTESQLKKMAEILQNATA